jgi:hypothetical protein
VREESLVLAIDAAAVRTTASTTCETITVFTTALGLSTITHISFLSMKSSISQGRFATILASLAIAMISTDFSSFEASAIVFLAPCSRTVTKDDLVKNFSFCFGLFSFEERLSLPWR